MSIPEGKLYGGGMLSPGRIAEHHPAEYTLTRVAEGDIKFGYAVVKGTGDLDVRVPAAANSQFVGVARWSTEASDFNNESYKAKDPVGVFSTGVPVVCVEEEVKIGDPVRVRLVANGEKIAGRFCKTREAGRTAVINNAEWHSASKDGVAHLYINGPFTTTMDT